MTIDNLLSRCRRRGDCHLWRRHISREGYGSVYQHSRKRLVHRVAYELSTGQPLALTDVVRARCGNKLCISPQHLERSEREQPHLAHAECEWCGCTHRHRARCLERAERSAASVRLWMAGLHESVDAHAD